jgi:hypothetical protein
MKHGSRETPGPDSIATINISIFSSNRPLIALPHETDAPSPCRESPSRRLPLPGIGVHLASQPRRPHGIALFQTRAGPNSNRRPSVNRLQDMLGTWSTDMDTTHRH